MSEAGSVPFPPIERHDVIGDRRTAALIAADGMVAWLFLPNYDSAPAFGALLDAQKGGLWRLCPHTLGSHAEYLKAVLEL